MGVRLTNIEDHLIITCNLTNTDFSNIKPDFSNQILLRSSYHYNGGLIDACKQSILLISKDFEMMLIWLTKTWAKNIFEEYETF